jgi:LuxR family maltose regulon positive regulatory protein
VSPHRRDPVSTGRHQQALEEFTTAGCFGSELVRPLALGSRVTGVSDLLQAPPGHENAHAALRADILNILPGAPAAGGTDRLVPPQAERLSRAELKVLGYLPTNLSRPEIASELSVSVNTVGTHIRSIYAKLGADDRSAAVRRARELQLLAAARRPAMEIPLR